MLGLVDDAGVPDGVIGRFPSARTHRGASAIAAGAGCWRRLRDTACRQRAEHVRRAGPFDFCGTSRPQFKHFTPKQPRQNSPTRTQPFALCLLRLRAQKFSGPPPPQILFSTSNLSSTRGAASGADSGGRVCVLYPASSPFGFSHGGMGGRVFEG